MCGTDREDVSTVQVAPATWNGFNDFAEVCAECQVSRRFKQSARPKRPRVIPSSTGLSDSRGGAAGATSSAGTSVQIRHRRTGVVLQLVESATLVQASLSGAALSGADLQHAALRGADLHRADLRLADLAGADLRGADLRGVNLQGADLRGADLRETRLFNADLRHSLCDGLTRWPVGFDANSSGIQLEGRRS